MDTLQLSGSYNPKAILFKSVEPGFLILNSITLFEENRTQNLGLIF